MGKEDWPEVFGPHSPKLEDTKTEPAITVVSVRDSEERKAQKKTQRSKAEGDTKKATVKPAKKGFWHRGFFEEDDESPVEKPEQELESPNLDELSAVFRGEKSPEEGLAILKKYEAYLKEIKPAGKSDKENKEALWLLVTLATITLLVIFWPKIQTWWSSRKG